VFAGTLEDHIPGSGDLGVLAVAYQGLAATPQSLTGGNTYSGGTSAGGGLLIVGPSQSNPLGSGALTLGGGTVSLQGRLDASQQYLTTQPYVNDVLVTGSATLDFQNSPTVSMGNLTVNNGGAAFNVTGLFSFMNGSPVPIISFGNVTLHSNFSINPGFLITASLGPISDGGGVTGCRRAAIPQGAARYNSRARIPTAARRQSPGGFYPWRPAADCRPMPR